MALALHLILNLPPCFTTHDTGCLSIVTCGGEGAGGREGEREREGQSKRERKGGGGGADKKGPYQR